jgi:hypothetical protein
MIEVGTRVRGAHGLGTVVALNERQPNRYFEERPIEAAEIASALGAVVLPDGTRIDAIGALADSLYDGDRYPYRVRFDTGYEDVYAEGELEVA